MIWVDAMTVLLYTFVMLLNIHIFNKKTMMNNKGKDAMLLIDNE